MVVLFPYAIAALMAAGAPTETAKTPFAQGGRVEDKATAEDLIKEGNRLRRAGDDHGGLRLYARAYAIYPSPRTAVQLGLCEQALGRWADAEAHLLEGLRAVSDPWIEKNRMAIEQSLRTVKAHVGSIEITGSPQGAEVFINGRKIGRLPVESARISAGNVDIEVRAPDGRPTITTVTLAAGQHQTVVVRADAVPAVSAASMASTPRSASRPEPLSIPKSGASADRRLSSAPLWRRPAVYALGGASVLLAGLGTWSVLRRNSHVQRFADAGCAEKGSDVVRLKDEVGNEVEVLNDPACLSIRGQYERTGRFILPSFIGAAVLASATLLLVTTTPSDSDVSSLSISSCQIGIGHAQCRVSF